MKYATIHLLALLSGKTTRLRHIVRYNNSPRLHDESVAEHSYYTALYAMIMGEVLNSQGFPVQVDIAAALLHDMEEPISGDILRNFKHSSPQLENAVEDSVAQLVPSMFSEFISEKGATTLTDKFVQTWQTAKQNSYSGDIVAFADFLSVLSYVLQELESGNRAILKNIEELDVYAASFNKRLLFRDSKLAQHWLDQASGIVATILEGECPRG